MARLQYIEKADVPAEHHDLMKRDMTLYKQLIHSPGALRAFQGLGYYIRHASKLDPRLRELAILQVGWLARSSYEWSHHIKIGYDFGVSDQDIEGLIADSASKPSKLEPLARLVLRAAREETMDGAISKSTFAELQTSLDNEQLVDLVVAIGFYNAVIRILATLEIDVEPEYQRYLEKYPFPKGGA